MFRFFLGKFITVLMLLILSFPAKAEDTNPFIRIKKQGKITVALYHGEYYPFFIKDSDHEYYGLDIDIAKDIAKNLDVELELVGTAKSFNDVITMVAEKKADIGISALSITLQRAKKVLFTEPYIVLHPAIIANRLKLSKDNQSPETILKSRTETISVIEDSAHVEIAKQLFPSAPILSFAKDLDAAKAVREDKAFAYLGDEVFVKYFLKNNPEESIYLKNFVFKEIKDEIAIAVNQDDYALRDWLNIYIKKNPPETNLDILFSHYQTH